jgi:hypothetical protein
LRYNAAQNCTIGEDGENVRVEDNDPMRTGRMVAKTQNFDPNYEPEK